MKSKMVRVEQTSGPEQTPVAMLVQIASQYESKIYIVNGESYINAKSIMGMMTLKLRKGMEIKVTADGRDEEQALNGIEKYLSNE